MVTTTNLMDLPIYYRYVSAFGLDSKEILTAIPVYKDCNSGLQQSNGTSRISLPDRDKRWFQFTTLRLQHIEFPA